MISPACCKAARVTSNRGSALGCTPTALQGDRTEEAAFFLVRSLQALQVLRQAGSVERGITGADTGFEQKYDPPTAVLTGGPRPPRPRLDSESHVTGRNRNEFGALLVPLGGT